MDTRELKNLGDKKTYGLKHLSQLKTTGSEKRAASSRVMHQQNMSVFGESADPNL